jgi:hypothetical protein
MNLNSIASFALGAAVGVLFMLLAALRAERRGAMRTADNEKIEREVRRVRAGCVPPRPSPPSPAPLSVFPATTVQRGPGHAFRSMARAAAASDFVNVGRARANPFAKDTQDFRTWAIEYSLEWNHRHAAKVAAWRRENGPNTNPPPMSERPPTPPKPRTFVGRVGESG